MGLLWDEEGEDISPETVLGNKLETKQTFPSPTTGKRGVVG